MRKNIKKSVFAFILSACFLLSGCAHSERECTIIDGKKIEFASEYEMEKWRGPLERLLSNAIYTQYSDDALGAIIGMVTPYPDRPAIEEGFGCALFDLTGDGVPELLVNMGGGSAGNLPYEVYDIYTGENTGSLDASPGDAICCYYDIAEGNVKVVNSSSWRNGWSSKRFYTSFITPEGGGFTEMVYLESIYEMGFEDIEADELDIVCKAMWCYVRNEAEEPESYLGECEFFEKNYIRISETGLEYVSWYDVDKEGDTPDERGAKMAAALLSTGQKFVVYDG